MFSDTLLNIKGKARNTKPLIGAIALLLLIASCGQPTASPTPIELVPEPTVTTVPMAEPTATTEPTPEPIITAEPTQRPTTTIGPTPKPTIAETTATETRGGSEFRVEMRDPQYGIGFAVPCFWEVNFPQEYPPGGSGISYSI